MKRRLSIDFQIAPTAFGLVPAIDVGQDQGTINWPTVKASGIDVAFIRTNGIKGRDAEAVTNLKGASSAGVLMIGYWYTGVNPAINAATAAHNDAFGGLAAAMEAGVAPDVWMADVERGFNPPFDGTTFPWTQNYVRSLPPTCALYGPDDILAKIQQPELPRSRIAPKWPLNDVAVAAAPRGWPSFCADLIDQGKGPVGVWDGWQFTSSGAVPGIATRVDCSVLRWDWLRKIWPSADFPYRVVAA